MHKKKLIKLLKIVLPLALGIFFVVYSYFGFTPVERQKLYENILEASPFWVVVSAIGGLLSHLSRAYRWKFLIEPMGYKLRLSNSFMAVMAAYLANLGIPRSGEVLRGATVATYEDIPFDKAFGTIIAERAADVLMLFIIVIITVLFHADELMAFFNEFHIEPWVTFLIIIGLIVLGVAGLILVKRSKLRVFRKIKHFVNGILQGVKSILNMKKNGAFIAHTLFIWVMYVLMFYVLKFAFPGLESLSFGEVMVAFVAGSFSISITNGGVGIYPIAVGAVLALFGINKELGEAFGWVVWGSQTLTNILVGGLSLLLLPVVNRKNRSLKNL